MFRKKWKFILTVLPAVVIAIALLSSSSATQATLLSDAKMSSLSGGKPDYAEYKGTVAAPGFNLMRITDRTIAVFEEYSGPGNIKHITIKPKVIALD